MWTICKNWWIIWGELEIIYKKEKVKVLEIKYCIGDQKFLQQAFQDSGYRRIGEFQDRTYQIEHKEKKVEKTQSIQEVRDNIQQSNTRNW